MGVAFTWEQMAGYEAMVNHPGSALAWDQPARGVLQASTWPWPAAFMPTVLCSGGSWQQGLCRSFVVPMSFQSGSAGWGHLVELFTDRSPRDIG